MWKSVGYGALVVGVVAGLGVLISNPIPHQACVGSSATEYATFGGELKGLEAELITDDLTQPSDVMHIPGTQTMLVTEKPGRVVAVVDGKKLDAPVLDITDRIIDDSNEQGLLTLEPHPDYATNCKVYLFYTDDGGHSNLVEARVSGVDAPTIDTRTFRRVLYVPQVHKYHQSGSIAFGPDGNMWVSIGDGGNSAERAANGQNPTTLKAAILRINDSRHPYGIPEDNPFVGTDQGAPEVWGYGVRNPWRISIHHETGQLYLPDVGHYDSEEINVVDLDEGGLNFGWPIVEGTVCFDADTCDPSGTRVPDYEYLHKGYGCAVVGGLVYRGPRMPELHGHYFFGDFCLGWVRSLQFDEDSKVEVHDWEPDLGRLGRVTSFGTDEQGELLVTSFDGELWQLVPDRDG